MTQNGVRIETDSPFVSRSISQSVSQSVSISVSQSVGQSVGRSVGPSVRPSVRQSVGQSGSQSVSQSKMITKAKKFSVFGENNSRHLFNVLQTHIFWKFDHISRTYNQINYRNIWFAKVTGILIMMAQVLFLDIFFEKDPHLNAIQYSLFICGT